METTYALWAIATIFVFVGVAGLALPAVPGAPVLFCGLVIAAWSEDFAYVGLGSIIALGLMALLTYVVDLLASALGAKKFGASKQAIVGAALGAVIGIFAGPLGILFGPFFGAVTGELLLRKELRAAGWAGIGATIGFLLGAVAKLAIAFSMIGLFAMIRFS
ncbi:MAG: DUF456 domain-containing protein [Gammaproteobacteria bacterium]|jgi:hypothetical protein|nr:DUF456 domain-containing protein [Gammaproteobacteria bacterium]MDP7093587.1 DUF456 domain-containing protein [Gammaproteobacteria bacterium]HJP05372.1 DUF456 domain-containing protein [Gammaproteobacteria bacterium]